MSNWILFEERAKVLITGGLWLLCLFARLLLLLLQTKEEKREARTRKKPNLTTLRVIREVIICSICGFNYRNEGKTGVIELFEWVAFKLTFCKCCSGQSCSHIISLSGRCDGRDKSDKRVN